MQTKLTLWTNAQLSSDAAAILAAGVAPHRLVVAARPTGNLVPSATDPALAEADVAFGQPDPRQVIDLPRLKWIHLSSAGYERYDHADIRQPLAARGVVMTNSSSVFDEPCAQHVLAFMLAHARALPLALVNQVTARVWRGTDYRSHCRLLVGDSMVILGFGAIARRLVELLAPFRMNIRAVRRQPRGDEPVPTHPISELNSLLPSADHVVNVLPASPGTQRFVDTSRFAAMKPGAVFYNVGRGVTVDQDALVASLNSGKLAAAYLDVVDPEPLPPDHALWQTANCYITPHTAGGHREEFVRLANHFLDNLRLFEGGSPLRDRIL